MLSRNCYIFDYDYNKIKLAKFNERFTVFVYHMYKINFSNETSLISKLIFEYL